MTLKLLPISNLRRSEWYIGVRSIFATLERNRLHEQIIEASECLKNWWAQGDDSDNCELEDEDDSDL